MAQKTLANVSAVILASGAGTRLGELTRTTPKPLLEFGGQPYLKYLLDGLIASGISDIVITACTHAQKISAFVENDSSYEGVVQVAVEDELLSTAESARFGLSRVANEQSFILTADTIWDVYLSAMFAQHIQLSAKATAMAFGNPRPDLLHVIPRVKVYSGENRVIDMDSPPTPTKNIAGEFEYLATAGLYLVETAHMLASINPEDMSLERESMNRLAPHVYVYRNEGLLLDYGLPNNYAYLKDNPEIITTYYPSGRHAELPMPSKITDLQKLQNKSRR